MNTLLFGGSTKKKTTKNTKRKVIGRTTQKKTTKKSALKKTTKKSELKKKTKFASGFDDNDELIAGQRRVRHGGNADELIAGNDVSKTDVSKTELTNTKKHIAKLKKEYTKALKIYSDNYKKLNKNMTANEIKKHILERKKSTDDNIKYNILEAESRIYSAMIDKIRKSL